VNSIQQSPDSISHSIAYSADFQTCFRSNLLPNSASNTSVIEAILDTCTPDPAIGSIHLAPVLMGQMHNFVAEAQALYEPESLVMSVLSLGSGHPGVTHMTMPSHDSIIIDDYLEALSENEVAARKMETSMKDIDIPIYFRFSVEQGMREDETPCDGAVESITAKTLGYLADEKTSAEIRSYIAVVDDDGRERITLSRLSTSLSLVCG